MNNQESKANRNIILIIGFMIFSTFFGAGNLIFPPYLGLMSGEQWFLGFAGFVIGDIVLAVMAVIATCKYDDINSGILTRSGKKFAIGMNVVMFLCVGPLLAIPRTAGVTFEVSISSLFPGVSAVLFSIIFFAITYAFALYPTKAVDLVGKILAPLLCVALGFLIIKGIITPIGEMNPETLREGNVFFSGVIDGYQTLDAVGGSITGALVATYLMDVGIRDRDEKVRISTKAGIIAVIVLTLVYGGLCFLGATVSTQFGADISQSDLLTTIVGMLFGETGKIILGIIVLLACLTTSIGLSSAVARFFTALFKDKIEYKYFVLAICVFSAIISNFGVSAIMGYSIPILQLLMPAFITTTVLSMFTTQIKNDNIFKYSVYVALAMGILAVLKVSFITILPLASVGFEWILPTIIGGIVGAFIHSKK